MNGLSAKHMTYTAVGTVIIAICSWITIPTAVPFTLQTFAVFLVLGILGGKYGTLSILCYILLGLAGIPVFSGFRGGIGTLLGATGGYILGFLATALFVRGFTSVFGKKITALGISFALGLLICYLFGTLWYTFIYTAGSRTDFFSALSVCVIGFIIPDIIKLSLALLLIWRFRKYRLPL